MFEYFIAKKYLVPKKKQLSVTLIAMMSVAVISLVVWLVLLFLSVTEGIEKTWLKKLTNLNAPVKITPTKEYYNSYYHLIDSQSLESDFTTKSLREKRLSTVTDPYDPSEDPELSPYFPKADLNEQGEVKDLVKELCSSIESLKEKVPSLVISDFVASGALLKLKLIREHMPGIPGSGLEQNFLTQMTYLAPLSEESYHLQKLLLKPRTEDAKHLFFLSSLSENKELTDEPENIKKASLNTFQNRLENLLSYIKIEKLQTGQSHFEINPRDLPDNISLKASAYLNNGAISHVLIPNHVSNSFKKNQHLNSSILSYGTLTKRNGKLFFSTSDKKFDQIHINAPLYIEDTTTFDARCITSSFDNISRVEELSFELKTVLQNQKFTFYAPLKGLKITSSSFLDISNEISPPPWPYYTKESRLIHINHTPGKDNAVILPKQYKDSGVLIGDRGFLSYGAATANTIQEQRLPVYVAGFYDPGIMAVGAKCALMHPDIIHQISTSSQSFTLDKNLASGFQIWFDNLDQTKQVKLEIENLLKANGLSKYFTVTSFYEYDFAKDLMTQFQSDKNLFSLIGIIILIVACSNIISFLVLMVNDKKKEIGILQAMGASKTSLALIFSSLGIFIGLIGSLIGTSLSLLTLKNIDKVTKFLSLIQGHEAFNSAYYGDSLPNSLSSSAVLFVLIATPIVSLLAGLIPARKACKVQPAQTLRSDV